MPSETLEEPRLVYRRRGFFCADLCAERLVEGVAPFELVIGNAHHVRLSYDDRPIDLAPHVKVEVARFTLD